MNYYNSEYNREYCKRNRVRRMFNRNVWQHKIRLEALIHYSEEPPKCSTCGITDLDVLCLDHINGDGYKDKKRKNNISYNLRKEGYPTGFQVLCANCNLKKAKQQKELERRN